MIDARLISVCGVAGREHLQREAEAAGHVALRGQLADRGLPGAEPREVLQRRLVWAILASLRASVSWIRSPSYCSLSTSI